MKISKTNNPSNPKPPSNPQTNVNPSNPKPPSNPQTNVPKESLKENPSEKIMMRLVEIPQRGSDQDENELFETLKIIKFDSKNNFDFVQVCQNYLKFDNQLDLSILIHSELMFQNVFVLSTTRVSPPTLTTTTIPSATSPLEISPRVAAVRESRQTNTLKQNILIIFKNQEFILIYSIPVPDIDMIVPDMDMIPVPDMDMIVPDTIQEGIPALDHDSKTKTTIKIKLIDSISYNSSEKVIPRDKSLDSFSDTDADGDSQRDLSRDSPGARAKRVSSKDTKRKKRIKPKFKFKTPQSTCEIVSTSLIESKIIILTKQSYVHLFDLNTKTLNTLDFGRVYVNIQMVVWNNNNLIISGVLQDQFINLITSTNFKGFEQVKDIPKRIRLDPKDKDNKPYRPSHATKWIYTPSLEPLESFKCTSHPNIPHPTIHPPSFLTWITNTLTGSLSRPRCDYVTAIRPIKGIPTNHGLLTWLSDDSFQLTDGSFTIWTRPVTSLSLALNDHVVDFALFSKTHYIIATNQGKLIRLAVDEIPDTFVYPFTLTSPVTSLVVVEKPMSFDESESAMGQVVYVHTADGLKCVVCISNAVWLEYTLNTRDYQRALEAVRFCDLDVDLVRKAKWTWSGMQEDHAWDIEVLAEVQDKRWVFEECLNLGEKGAGSSRRTRQVLKVIVDETAACDIEMVEREIALGFSGSCESAKISAIEMAVWRLKAFQRLDRLSTFENVYASLLSENFNTRFSGFLAMNLVDFAVKKMSHGEYRNVEVLFTRHGKILLPYRLAIIDSVSVVSNPEKWTGLLKNHWTEIPWRRRKDWTDDPKVKEFVELIDDTVSEKYAGDLVANVYPESDLVLKEWYLNRIYRTEQQVGQIDYCLYLFQHAIEMKVDVGQEYEEFKVFCRINHRNSEFCDNFNVFREWTAVQVVESVLVSEFKTKAQSERDLAEDVLILKRYLKQERIGERVDELVYQRCVEDPTSIAALIRMAQRDSEIAELISIQVVLEKLAYGEKQPDSLDFWQGVFEALLEKPDNVDSVGDGIGESWGLEEVQGIDFEKPILPPFAETIKMHVGFAQFLKSHGFDYSVRQVGRLSQENCRPLVTRFLYQSKTLGGPQAQAQVPGEDTELKKVVDELVGYANAGLLNNMGAVEIYTEAVLYALSEGRFSFAQAIFYPKVGGPVLSPGVIEKLVLSSAYGFFDNDQEGDKDKGLMKQSRSWYVFYINPYCKSCSLLKSDIPGIKAHLDLIDATHILIHDYGVANDAYTQLLPIQVRLHRDRVQLLKSLLEQSPALYQKRGFITGLLAKLLGPALEENERALILLRLFSAQAALTLEAFDDVYNISIEFLKIGALLLEDETVSLIFDLVQAFAESEGPDMKKKILLVSFAVKQATPENLGRFIGLWRACMVRTRFDRHSEFKGMALMDVYSRLEQFVDHLPLGSPTATTGINCIDFYRTVGAPIAGDYDRPGVFENEDVQSPNFYLNIMLGMYSTDIPDQEQKTRLFMNLARDALKTDTPSCIIYLLASGADEQSLLDFFNDLEPSLLNYALATYFFSFKAALLFFDAPRIEQITSLSLAALPKIVWDAFGEMDKDAVQYENVARLLGYSNEYVGKIESGKVSKLWEVLSTLLDADSSRLSHDHEYRAEMILRLAQTGTTKVLDTSLLLAEQDNIPVESVWRSHVEWLFMDDSSSVLLQFDGLCERLILNFEQIRPSLPKIHLFLCAADSKRLELFYGLILKADLEKTCMSPRDVEQLLLRLDILKDIRENNLDQELKMDQLIYAIQDGPSNYHDLWAHYGLYVGLGNFIGFLLEWVSIMPVICLKEAFHPKQDVKGLTSETIRFCLLNYTSSIPWITLDNPSIQAVFADIFPVFERMTHDDIASFIHHIVTHHGFSLSVRDFLFRECERVFGRVHGKLEEASGHVAVISGLARLVDPFGERVSNAVIGDLDAAFGKPAEMRVGIVGELAVAGVSPWIVERICSAYGIDLMNVYSERIGWAIEHDILGAEVMVMAVLKYASYFEEDAGWGDQQGGWGEENLGLEKENSVMVDLKQTLQVVLSEFSLDSGRGHKLKMVAFNLLEKHFILESNHASKISQAKLSSFISLHWHDWDWDKDGFSIASTSTSNDYYLLFTKLLEKSKKLVNLVNLLKLLLDWKGEKTNLHSEIWKKFLVACFDTNNVDFLLITKILIIPCDLIDLETDLEIMNLLGQKQPFSNEYFIYGLSSIFENIQTKTIEDFNLLHPNSKSYQITYHLLLGLGYFKKLIRKHEIECIEGIMKIKYNPIAICLISIVLYEYSSNNTRFLNEYSSSNNTRFLNERIKIIKKWFGIDQGLIKGFKIWIEYQDKIIREAAQDWIEIGKGVLKKVSQAQRMAENNRYYIEMEKERVQQQQQVRNFELAQKQDQRGNQEEIEMEGLSTKDDIHIDTKDMLLLFELEKITKPDVYDLIIINAFNTIGMKKLSSFSARENHCR